MDWKIIKRKGIEDILYSIKDINRKKYKLFILGNGNEKSKIQEFIRFEKLQKTYKYSVIKKMYPLF